MSFRDLLARQARQRTAYLRRALKRHHYNVTQLAAAEGLNRTALYKRLRRDHVPAPGTRVQRERRTINGAFASFMRSRDRKTCDAEKPD